MNYTRHRNPSNCLSKFSIIWTLQKPSTIPSEAAGPLSRQQKTGHTAYIMELTPEYTDVIVKRYFRIAGKDQIKLMRDGEEMPPEYYAEVFEDLGISPEYQEGEYE